MAIIIDSFEQMSAEWLNATAGNPGASNASKILTTKGERSKSRDDYMMQLAGEFITGKREEGYTSQAMINGMEREAASRNFFEMIYGVEVKQVGLVYKDERRLYHVSPDGLINNNAGLELKNPQIKTQIRYLLEKAFPMDYFIQVQMNLFVTERDLWYFMSAYEGLPPFIIEVRRNEGFIKILERELNQFTAELAAMVKKISGPEEKKPPEEFAPKECPERPGDIMLKQFCDECVKRLGCTVWG
jgi:hypothetical protein